LSARAAKPKPRLLAWLAVCAVALALLLYALSVVVDGGGTDGDSATPAWQPLPVPPASGEVTLVEAAGRLLVVIGSAVRELDEDSARWSEPVPIPGPPRSGEAIVGTPGELIVWGGQTGDGSLRNDGYAYAPGSPDWRRIEDSPLSARQGATGIWTGREVVVIGGGPDSTRTEVGTAAYDPAGDAGRPLAPADQLTQASTMASAWTGEQVAVWAYREATAEAVLLTLDVEGGGGWTVVVPPPFPPLAGGSGLAGDRTSLVATATGRGPAQAAVHPPDQASALEQWRPIASPPIPAGEVCPSELEQAAGRTVLLSQCNQELFLLADGTWRPLPRPPESSAREPAQTLVTEDAVYYLTPGAAGVAPSLLRLDLP
jgi:hypothetical protein